MEMSGKQCSSLQTAREHSTPLIDTDRKSAAGGVGHQKPKNAREAPRFGVFSFLLGRVLYSKFRFFRIFYFGASSFGQKLKAE
ncbi:MAG: hypothetical protein JXB10_11775, partial [Pirellulales bacterium]|nr:hypothetical protein [Pirellulales bacterium]